MTAAESPEPPAGEDGPRRRTVLAGGLGAVGGAALALGAARLASPLPSAESAGAAGRATTPFRGAHQPGVITEAQAHATFVAFDLLDGADREALVRLMRVWTDDIERLASGRPGLADVEPELAATPAGLTVTVGYGPGFLAAAGLARRAPDWLAPLPAFGVDRLEGRWSDGDALLQVCADDPLTVAHAVRVLTRGAQTFAAVRWVQHGFRHAAGSHAPGTTMRNLMGQLDGSRNLRGGTDDALIWCGSDQQDWLTAGTAVIVRRIAMDLDGWEQLGRSEREAVIGRRLADGSPLTGSQEHDEPDLSAKSPLGLPVIDMFAHIRRAVSDNPDERFLRRSYNYDEPPTTGQHSNSGLVFVAYAADPVRQFVPIQSRLDELDLLNRWTTPIGSAVFAVPPGARTGEYLGERLLGA